MFETWPLKKSTSRNVKNASKTESRINPCRMDNSGSKQLMVQRLIGARSDVKTGSISSILSLMDEYRTSSPVIFRSLCLPLMISTLSSVSLFDHLKIFLIYTFYFNFLKFF